MSGYDIDAIEPGSSGGGGGGGGDAWTTADINELLANTSEPTVVALTETAIADDTAYADPDLFGWSVQNTAAGLSTVYIRLGNSDAATPFIAINLAENETVSQIFPNPISSATGFFVTVEAGSVNGILYTG